MKVPTGFSFSPQINERYTLKELMSALIIISYSTSGLKGWLNFQRFSKYAINQFEVHFRKSTADGH